MASEVDISNLALSRLGDSAIVASISPPDGSAQADHCARFYPIARDSMLEMHAWGFATKRCVLALVDNPWTQWRYCYAVPNDAIKLLGVYQANASNDYSDGRYTPQEFASEVDTLGRPVIYTNCENAHLRYTAAITDSAKFSALFVDALGWLLASHLAGTILKGDAGMSAARNCLAAFAQVMGKAAVSDANQQRNTMVQSTSWIAGR